ncbi:hypothetical protein CRV03_05875 [Arcobacter sp. F155]|nr:hypothetical protein CRV03_05875 [Arcobacter sp. F155]
MSIKPRFVKEIIAGTKTFEFRKKICQPHNIEKVYIYSSSPMKKIIGSFDLNIVLEGLPEEIWESCKDGAGVTKEYFMEYYQDKEKAYALQIENLKIFDNFISPYETNKNFTAPQSYMYIDNLSINSCSA